MMMARLSTVMELPFDDDDGSTVEGDGAFVFSSPVKKKCCVVMMMLCIVLVS